MYSGIIHHHGTVGEVLDAAGGGKRIHFDVPTIMHQVVDGSSVNVDGVCLTALDCNLNGFWSDVMPQTLELTTAGSWKVGQIVNVEPSMRLGDELGGHFVYGHVDGVAEIVEMEEKGNALIVLLRAPQELMRYIVPQGSIALDGVSLTIADVQDEVFAVSLTPETIERTVWKDRGVGDRVNFEADMMIKYLWAKPSQS
ncbi:MAG: riboflavin synthase [Patescibacteria group bacterium]